MVKNISSVELDGAFPSRSLTYATVALLKVQGEEIDAAQLEAGLPLHGRSLTDALLDRALLRLGYALSWTEIAVPTHYQMPCVVPLRSGGFSVVLSKKDGRVQLLRHGSTTATVDVTYEVFRELHEEKSFQVSPSLQLLQEKHSVPAEEGHWFWSRLLLKKSQFFDVFISSLFANILAIMISFFVLQVYDRVIPGQSEATLWVLAIGVGFAIFFEALLKISRARVIDGLGKTTEIQISRDIFQKVLGMKLGKQPATPSGIAHMVREFSAVKEFFTTAAIGVVVDLPFVFLFLLLIYGIAGPVVWVVVVGACLTILPSFLLQRKMAKLSEENMGGMSSASRILTESLYGLETVKVTRSEPFFQRQWEEVISLNAVKTTEQRSVGAFLSFWAVAMQQSTYVLSVIAGVYLVFAGSLTVGSIIAVSILTTRTLSPITQLSQILSKWQNMRTALNAVNGIITSEQDRSSKKSYVRRPALIGRISASNLKFSHQGSETHVLDIDGFKIDAGTHLALLGANGSGKSTFLRIIAGLYAPDAGELTIDGLDARQIDPLDLRRNIGYLPQEIRMFRGSLRENLGAGTAMHDDRKMLEALDFGGLGDFVKKHPEGLDLQLADGGDGLSIGQRQSIGLARIYLQDPQIVLLDEPTAALDQNLENALVGRIGQWIGSRTCIVATHRLQILSQMSHVAMMNSGRIVRYGERDEFVKVVSPNQMQNS